MAASPEALLLSAVIRKDDLSAFTRTGVMIEMFTGHREEAEWFIAFMDKYNKVPPRSALLQKFPEFTIYKVDSVDYYADEVKQAYARSAVTDLLDDAVQLILDGNLDKAVEQMSTQLLHVQAVVQDANDDYDLATDWEKTYNSAKLRVDRVCAGQRAGVPTGWSTVDLNTGGLQPGWMVIFGGRLSAGKTWGMIRMAHEAVVNGYTALYMSLEQPRDQIAMRTHTMLSQALGGEVFRHLDLQRGSGFDLMDYKKFLQSLEEQVPGRFVINDTSRGRVGPIQVAAAIEREEPDIVFVDYMTLMKQNGDGGWLSVADLSASMQQLAQRYEIPVVLGAQLNRTAMGDDEPDAGQIGRSDAVGQDADLVIMVTKKTNSVRKMSLAKNRHGPDGLTWMVRWKPNTGDIEEITGNEAEKLIEDDRMED